MATSTQPDPKRGLGARLAAHLPPQFTGERAGLRPPGNPPGPPLYRLPATIREFAVDPLSTIERYTQRYGDVVCVPVPFEPVYTLNHPDDIEEMLVKKRSCFIKSRTMRELDTLVGDGLLISEGQTWKRNRKLMAPPLARNHIAGYAEEMVELTAKQAAEWRDGQVLDVHHEMTRLTLEITVRTLFATPLTGDVGEIAEALETAMEAYHVLWQTWQRFVPRSWPTPVLRRLRDAARRLDEALLRVIRARRAAGAKPEDRDLLSLLMRARDDAGAGLDETQLRDEALTIFVAGHETTALALSYTLHVLGTHPELLARVHDELDTVLEGRAPALDDLSRLTVLSGVIKESLRLYPPAWGIGRQVVEPVEIGGYDLPVGAQVMTTTWAVHRDARWWPDPLRVDPDRWTDEAVAAAKSTRPRYAYFPFGGGPRVCIGNHFALMETTLALAAILQQWSLSDLAPETLSFFPSVTLRPATSITARLSAR